MRGKVNAEYLSYSLQISSKLLYLNLVLPTRRINGLENIFTVGGRSKVQ